MNYREKYEYWLKNIPETDPIHKELLEIGGDEKELRKRFEIDMTFGTAGLRGIVGAGTSRMNYYTVGRATRGIAAFICEHGEEAMKKGVIIAHDPRHFSKEFSRFAAGILAEAGIRVYVFPDLRPTPELAWAIRKLGTVSGINITASHNPKEYNGYKAYWTDGCQVSADIADGMMKKISELDYFGDFDNGNYEEALKDGRIIMLGEEYDRGYLDAIEALAIHGKEDLALDIPIVYTPLNGAGSIPFRRMMEDREFTDFHIVKEQEHPDPDFTTVGYPNPEAPAAFALSEKLGHELGAELLMATDPDSDRFAIELLDENGEYVPLNGNQTGYLLVNYILEGHKDAGTLPDNGAMVKSIVTSTMSTRMAEAYGVKMFEALTGFKNICGRIPELEEKGLRYLFGYEESVGYAPCVDIRDKDGISAGMLVAEAAAYYRKQGKTLFQVLDELYRKYGFYAEDEPNIILKGLDGAARIRRMMSWFRENLPKEVAGIPVKKAVDYQNGYEDIPASNVLRLFLDEEDTWFAVRPSGTEPKIKFYFYTRQDSREKALEVNAKIKEEIFRMIQSVE